MRTRSQKRSNPQFQLFQKITVKGLDRFSDKSRLLEKCYPQKRTHNTPDFLNLKII